MHYAFSAAPDARPSSASGSRRTASRNRPVEHDGGDRSVYLEDPEGNVVEIWDFFGRGQRVGEP